MGERIVAAGNHGCEIFDLATRAWTNGPEIPDAFEVSVLALDDNQFLAVASAGRAVVVDVVANTAKTVSSVPGSASQPPLVRLLDGRILTCGNGSWYKPLNGCSFYDPATESWLNGPLMSEGRGGHTMTTLLDGTVLIVGGGRKLSSSSKVSESNAVEILDPATASVRRSTDTAGRMDHTATLLPDGRVLIAGGSIPGDADSDIAAVPLLDTRIFDPRTERWTKWLDLRSEHRSGDAVLIGSNQLFLTAFYLGEKMELVDLRTSTSQKLDLPIFRRAIALTDRSVLVTDRRDGAVVGIN